MKTIRIKDYYGVYQEVPVSDEIYEEYRNFHREEDRLHKRAVYHGCFVPLDSIEESISTGGIDALIDDLILKEEVNRLYKAIAKLTPIQRRRLLMIMEDMTYEEVAKKEGRSCAAIHFSVSKALKHLRKLMTD